MYNIRPLKQAEIDAPIGVAIMMGDMRTLVTGTIYIWVIEGEGERIVVDAGVEEPRGGFVHGFPVRGGGEKRLREALEGASIRPEDVDKLILTHLHYDHVAYATLFHNARIYVQKREWQSALNPPPHYRQIYDEKLILPLEDMDLCLLDHDEEIADGIRVVLLPGHTKGLQGVLVKTRKGNYLIAGDHFYSYINISPPKEPIELIDATGNKIKIPAINLPFAPPGLHIDLTEWYESCFKALNLTRRQNIIPSHDPLIEGRVFP
ncbi:MAG: N-acyl homoserine lactonase family protein [Candidatus Nezhaarchaeota archaeon]|nr:N-acyl homoserine lactonase family protein [Candidatus Nezhaarchaeota archaeon]MCX8141597.1 N-acyl homoserine lactonase family protein [Candidatus Nezhaarchaeota archaeon]MDW8049864.1 N-acyl homoserine lactonase family protein [Nitrososphaerota archaeon]